MYLSGWMGARRRLGAGLLAVALLLTVVAGTASMTIEPVWTIDIPISADRSLLLMFAVRAIPDDAGGSGIVWYDVRLRVGREDRRQDTYEQLVDEVVPLWPP